MTVVQHQDALSDWLVDYLEADSTLMGMCNGDVSPEIIWGTNPSPFVKFDFLDGEDLIVIGLHTVWQNSTYHVRGAEQWRGSGRPDRSEVNAIGARLYDLLHDHEAVTATIHVCSWREEPTPTPTVTEADGSVWLCSGGVYRFLATAL